MRDDLARMIKSGHPSDFESDINACMNCERLVDLMHRDLMHQEMASGIVGGRVDRE